MSAVVLGVGVLNWHRHERVGDRYGAVNLIHDGEEWPDPVERFAEAPEGKVGSLRAEVVEPRESRHIGDLYHGLIQKEAPERGASLELGHGELFLDPERGLGVRPDRELAVEGRGYTGDFRECPECGGTGYAPEARQVADTFYCLGVQPRELAERLRWVDKLGQPEVDNLVDRGRLRVRRDGEWVSEPRGAEEINALNRRQGLDSHDAINRLILVEFRCERLGIPLSCEACGGQGDLAPEGVDRNEDRPLPADRETWWLDPTKLYAIHESVVRLTFEEDSG